MNFYICNNNVIDKIQNDELCVLIDNLRCTHHRKNIIIPFDGIFSYNGEQEIEFYNIVANKMRKAGFDGFRDWIEKCMYEFSNHIYYDDNEKPIKYNDEKTIFNFGIGWLLLR